MSLSNRQRDTILALYRKHIDTRRIARKLQLPLRNVASVIAWVKIHKARHKRVSAFTKARAAEAASKEALRSYCEKYKWRLAFFEGATGAPRTGIIDAIAFRVGRQNPDILDLRLVQLKGGHSGISGIKIKRLKKAASSVVVNWLIAAFDGETLHLLPAEPAIN
jgi:hypothetical protein